MNKLDLLSFPLEGRSLIEASAGTGKTFTIAALYLRALIEHKYQPQQILVVTFTKAATQELRERIRSLIKDALNFLLQQGDHHDHIVKIILNKYPQHDWDDICQHLADCLVTMDESSIFTIHGFVHRVLSESAFETGNMFEMELVDSDDDLLEIACNDFWRICVAKMNVAELELLDAVFSTPFGIKKELRQLLRGHDIKLMPDLNTSVLATDDFINLCKQAKELWLASYDEITGLINDATDKKYLNGTSYKSQSVNYAYELINGFFTQDGLNLNVPEKAKYLRQDFIISKKKKGLDDKIPYHRFFDLWEQISVAAYPLSIHFKIKLLQEATDYCTDRLVQLKLRNRVMAHDDILDLLNQSLQSRIDENTGRNLLADMIRHKYPLAMIDEFQDTDSIQYQIFTSIYSGNSNLIMIGDPKQAIYSFRGGDIFTYLQAQRETKKPNRFTLDTNWRSTTGLITAVNSIFSCRDEPFIYKDIGFINVNSSGKHDDYQLEIADSPAKPLTIWHIPVTDENLGERPKGYIKNDSAKQQVAQATAGEIVRLLDPGTKAMVEGRPIKPKDITVLVRSGKQANLIIESLRFRGLACAYQGNDSIFASNQALEFNMILHALAYPENESYLLAAMATSTIGKTSSQIIQMQQDEKGWDQFSQFIFSLHHLWQKGHFIQAIYQFLHELDIPSQCLQKSDGERQLTNILHLIELLQQASHFTHGINGLVSWYQQQITEESAGDEKQLRLESDSDLINVVTIHKSKGLEYSVVFAPFMWDSGSNRSSSAKFHQFGERGDVTTIIDLGSDELKESKEQAAAEELAEELRLLYVALTRAKHKCYISWGKIAYFAKSPLGYLLDSEQKISDLVSSSSDSIEFIDIPDSDAFYSSIKGSESSLESKPFAGRIKTNFGISSFTWLAQSVDHHHDTFGVGIDATQAQFQELAQEQYNVATEQIITEAKTNAIFDFPKGARAGVFFHHILENIDFQNVDSEQTDVVIEKSLRKFGFERKWFEVVRQNVIDVINCRLDGSGISLAMISKASRINEMEFLLSHQSITHGQLNFVLNKYEKYNRIDRPLEFGEVEGFFKGFIDLTFEHNGKYYIVDYKTNHLGSDYSLYNNEALQQSIIDHDYDLQYIIYSAALHKYLAQTMQNYSYETHFGGVYYLYLRGINGDGISGIYYDMPPLTVLEEIF